MTRAPGDEELVTCNACNGTGIDDADFTGKCAVCGGHGERMAVVESMDDDDCCDCDDPECGL